jgi:hypothetical protein
MWPFSANNQEFPGIFLQGDKVAKFTLSDDEADAAKRAMSVFKDVAVRSEHAEKIKNGIIAVALSHYAQNLVAWRCSPTVGDECDWSIIEPELRKAVAAVWKASLISPLPIYLYHRARYLKLLGMTKESLRLFALFFAKQCEFEPDTIEEMQMKYEGTDIEYALAVAEGSV